MFPMVEFKYEYSKYRHKLSQKKRRKEEIPCGFKLPNENFPTNCQMAKNKSSNVDKEKEKDGFEYGGVCFKELANGKVKMWSMSDGNF